MAKRVVEELISLVKVDGVPEYTQAMNRLGAASGIAAGGLNTLSTAALALGGAMSAMNVKGLMAASSMQRELKSLEALGGSAEFARQQFAWFDARATKSIFNLTELVEAGKLMTAFGLDAQHWLPLADDLAAGMNKRLEDVADVLGRLKAGQFGEAFEQLRRFGIGTQQLMREGLKFDKGGQFVGSVDQAMAAVERIMRRRFGGLSEKLAQETLSGALSNLKDETERLFRGFGDTELGTATHAVRAFTNALESLRKSLGPTERMALILAGPGLSIVGGITKGVMAWRTYTATLATAQATQAMAAASIGTTTAALNAEAAAATRASAAMAGAGPAAAAGWLANTGLAGPGGVGAAGAAGAMGAAGAAGTKQAAFAAGSVPAGLGGAAATAVASPARIFIGSAVITLLSALTVEGLAKLGGVSKDDFERLATPGKLAGERLKYLEGLSKPDRMAAIREAYGGETPREKAERLTREQHASARRLGDAAPWNFAETGALDPATKAAMEQVGMVAFAGMRTKGKGAAKDDPAFGLLSRIADASERTAQAVDLRRIALGGGELGRVGITPSELALRKGNIYHITVHGGTGDVVKALQTLDRQGRR